MSVSKEDLQKVHDWRQAQATSLASACFTLSGLILSPLLAAILSRQSDLDVWHLFVYPPGALLAGVSGALWHREARRQQVQYLKEVDTEREVDMERDVGTEREVLQW